MTVYVSSWLETKPPPLSPLSQPPPQPHPILPPPIDHLGHSPGPAEQARYPSCRHKNESRPGVDSEHSEPTEPRPVSPPKAFRLPGPFGEDSSGLVPGVPRGDRGIAGIPILLDRLLPEDLSRRSPSIRRTPRVSSGIAPRGTLRRAPGRALPPEPRESEPRPAAPLGTLAAPL